MQPPAPAGAPGGPPPAPRPRRPGERESERNLFGVEFPWARGAVTADGKTYKGVGLRYAGNASYMASAGGLKRSLLVDLDRSEHADFHGLRAMQLHGGALDPRRRARPSPSPSSARPACPRPARRSPRSRSPSPASTTRSTSACTPSSSTWTGRSSRIASAPTRACSMKPQGLRGLDFLGDDWERYKGQYRPQAEPTQDEAKRVIEFARLVNQGDDEQFRKEIGSYLDVDAFLRFMAVNALIANLESFFALGHNYSLYLDPKTNKFVFIPGDLEFSFANFLLMGSADQLMDLSLDPPVPGREQAARPAARHQGGAARSTRSSLKELAATVFTQGATPGGRRGDREGDEGRSCEKEAAARAERAEPPAGFGRPGGAGGRPTSGRSPRSGPASVAAQLAGKSKGYVPQFGFGPPPRRERHRRRPIDEKTFREVVKAPPEFEVTLFAAPPKVNYPVAIAAAPDGAVYVAVDEQGSLGRTPGGGKILRCVDEDGDGKVDGVTVFAKVEHPRGVIAQDGKVWVMHPPTLSVFHDDDGDGVSDRQEVLVTGPDDRPDRRARRRPHDQRRPHGHRRLALHRRRRLRHQGGEGEGRHDARRSAAAASSACGPTAPSWRSSPPACATRSTSPSTRS